MAAQHPIIKYRLTPQGRTPDYLCKHEGSFAGMYGVNTNKEGYIPAWLPPQETQYLGLGCGPIDPDGAPAGVEVIRTKTALQTYIPGITTTWTVDSEGVTGIRTETTTGTLEAWNPGEDYAGPGLTTTTSDTVVTAAPAGTVIEHTGSYVTRIVTETASSSGVTTSTQEFEITHPYTNITITGTSDVVGVVTTTAGPGGEGEEVTTTTTTTTTTATHQDITEGYSDSFRTVDEDGVVTKTRTRTYREVTKVRNPFDPVAATEELWNKYKAVNGL